MPQQKFNLMMPEWLRSTVERLSAAKGISMAEYIKDAVKEAVERDRMRESDKATFDLAEEMLKKRKNKKP